MRGLGRMGVAAAAVAAGAFWAACCAGALTPEFLDNGLNTFKFVRYLAGLSENIAYTDELNDLGQHGAVILAALGQLTHTPSRPADMGEAFYKKAYKSTTTANIHMSTAKTLTLQDAVIGFCDDSDEGNIDRLGHRRWMLNPAHRVAAALDATKIPPPPPHTSQE